MTTQPKFYVIMKNYREYDGGPGYIGPSWNEVLFGRPPEKFSSLAEAEFYAEKLSDVNPVGFRVEEYYEIKKESR